MVVSRVDGDAASHGVAMITSGGSLLYTNEAFARMHGYTAQELLGRHLSTLQVRDDPGGSAVPGRPFVWESVEGVREVFHRRRNGTVFPVLTVGTAVRQGEGDAPSLYVAAVDIDERRQREDALRASERHYRLLADSVADVIWTVDLGLRFSYISPSITRMVGYSAEEAKDLTLDQLLTPDSFQVAIQSFEEELALENMVEKDMSRSRVLEFEVIRRDGSTLWIETEATFLRGRDGLPYGVIGIARDISERRRAEMALRQAEEFASGLLARSPNPVLVLHADTAVGYVNNALEKLTGFSAAELVGTKPPYPWWPEENRGRLRADLRRAMLRGGGKPEQRFRNRNGQEFWARVTSVRVETQANLGPYLEYWVDVTEERRLRENTAFYISQITRAQEEERERVAHELHDESIQRLSALCLGIDAIARDRDQLPAGVVRQVKQIRAEINGVVGSMRSFIHRLRPGVIDQLGLVSALEILADEMSKDGTTDVSFVVVGRQRHLVSEKALTVYRIAQEALHNVVRHAGATQARVRLKFAPSKIRLTISDNGRGFEAPTALRELAARGKLGLIGMQERARLLDGRLLIRSRVGAGTTVVVEADAGPPGPSSQS